MSSKVRIGHIITAHLATLRNYESGKVVPKDILTFLGVPTAVAVGLVQADVRLPDTAINALIGGLAIFAGLLFNLLLLVADVAVRTDYPDRPSSSGRLRTRVKLGVLKELHANVSFAVLVALGALVLLIGVSMRGQLPIRWLAEGAIYFFGTLFFLTLIMVLKRAHALLGSEVDEAERKVS